MLNLLAWPSAFHQDAPVLQNSPDFVDDYLDVDQQAAVGSPHGDVTLHPVVGESGEGEGAVGPDVEAGTIKGLHDSTAKGAAGVWPRKDIYLLDMKRRKQIIILMISFNV